MRQYCTARAEEDEQGNVYVDESENVLKEEEEDLDAIMGEVREALTISFPFQGDIPLFASSAPPPPPPPESPPRLIINFVIIIA